MARTQTPKSLIVAVWSGLFALLGKLSLFDVLRKLFPPLSRSYRFVEIYVVAHTLLSLIALAISTYRRDYGETTLLFAMTCYGVFRTFEIFVYQVNVLLFDEYRANQAGRTYAVKGYRRIVILLLHNCLEIVAWFGVVFMWFFRSGQIALQPGTPEPTFFRVFHESLLVMFSFAPGESLATTDAGIFLFSLQAIVGPIYDTDGAREIHCGPTRPAIDG